LKGLSLQKANELEMVKESIVNFNDPKLSKELSLIENNRIDSLVSLDRIVSKFLSIIF
tara:strand:+ start:400 stop:573 length:174 start_codon:yes stop_codon:yes gene_type:complete